MCQPSDNYSQMLTVVPTAHSTVKKKDKTEQNQKEQGPKKWPEMVINHTIFKDIMFETFSLIIEFD